MDNGWRTGGGWMEGNNGRWTVSKGETDVVEELGGWMMDKWRRMGGTDCVGG